MGACSGLEAFCRGEEDGLLSVKKDFKKVRFIFGGSRYMLISEGIRNMKEYESASFYGCYMSHDVVLIHTVEIGSEIERLWAVKSLGQSRSAFCILRQKALWVASGNGVVRAEKPRYDLPHGVGVKN